jgi:anthranilate synthase component 1
MYIPDIETFRRRTGDGSYVPVYRERRADLDTPVSVYMKMARSAPSFLLESVEQGEKVGRYSFIGTRPSAVIEARGEVGVVRRADGTQRRVALEAPGGPDPLHLVQQELAAYRVSPTPGLPRFFGGAVGFLSYDAVRYFERLPAPEHDELQLPDATFMVAETVVIFDHVTHTMKVVSLAPADGYQQAVDRIDQVLADLSTPLPPEAPPGHPVSDGYMDFPASAPPPFTSNFTRERFQEAVVRAKEYIYAGDIFQVVPSHRLRRTTAAPPLAIYRALRMLNPSPYMFYLDMGDFQLIGSSPEMLVRLEEGQTEYRPLAGTRRRGQGDVEDRELAQELLADPKERAEHVMLVDLGRNDLGRVCRYGTVRVPRYMDILKYSHVIHIESTVTGELLPEYDAYSLLRSCFPAGTLSGAPKIRAMEIIAELEGTRRGPYGGAVGYFGFGGNMDTCITIRTIVKIGDMVYLQAGGGIVADSVPAEEWQETLNKTAALSRAIEMAESGSL